MTPVLLNLAVANGIALSTDERTLWVTETLQDLTEQVSHFYIQDRRNKRHLLDLSNSP